MKRLVVSKSQIAVWLLAAVTIPWQLGGKEPVAVLVSFLLMLLGTFLLWRSGRVRNLSLSGWRSWLSLGFLGWAGLSLVWSVNRYQTIVWLEVLTLAILAYFVAQSFADDEQLRWQWLDAYIVIATAASLWGGIIYVAQSYNRLTSSFYLANPFAAYVLPAVLLATWRFARTGKWFYGVCATLLATALVLTDSRSAFLMIGLAVVVGLGTRLTTRHWLRLGGVAVVGLILVLAANTARSHLFHQATAVQGTRFAEAAKGESTSGSDRINYLKSTVAIWRHYPVLGTGAGTFGTMHPQYQYRVISAASNAHNFYVQTLSELGVVGGVLLAVMIIGLLWFVIVSFRTKSGRLLALVLAVMIVHAALDIDALYPSILVLVGMLAGWVIPPPKASAVRIGTLGVVMALALIMLVPATSANQSRRLSDAGLQSQDTLDFQGAIDNYASAHSRLVYDPDVITAEAINYYTLAGFASTAEASQDYDKAKQLAVRAQQLDPEDSQHMFLYARILFKQHDNKGAEAAYQRAIELDPYNHPEYYADLANLYVLTGRPAQVITTVTAVLRQYPADVVANRSAQVGLATNLSALYYFRGLAELTSKPGQAKIDIRSAVKFDQSNMAAVQLLSQLGG